jgi:5-bromo-4-chloroindolyl phosphate hydrolysis protein
MNKDLVSKLAAFGGATCVFVSGMAAFPLSFIGDLALAGPLSAATGLGIWYFFPGRRPATAQDIKDLYRHIDDIAAGTSGVDTKLVVEAIKMGSDKLDRILMEATQIKSPNTIRRIKHIDAIGRKIIEDFRVDPKDVLLAQSWLNSYLDETITLVKGYAQLSRTGARNLEAQKQMAQFDEMLDTIDDNFQKLLDKLLANDVMDFDVNMTVMKNRLNNEGI